MKRIRKALERGLRFVVEPAVSRLVGWRVHPNALSTAGFLITCSAGYFFHQQNIRTAGALVLAGGIFDILDGTVARRTELASSFGAFYDSTLDRLSEIVVYLGLLSLYNAYPMSPADIGMMYVILLAMGGSLMISYTRARAEGLGIPCSVGLMQRAERIVLVGVAALFFGGMFGGIVLSTVIVALAVLTVFTSFQRIVWVYRYTRPEGEPRTREPVGRE